MKNSSIHSTRFFIVFSFLSALSLQAAVESEVTGAAVEKQYWTDDGVDRFIEDTKKKLKKDDHEVYDSEVMEVAVAKGDVELAKKLFAKNRYMEAGPDLLPKARHKAMAEWLAQGGTDPSSGPKLNADNAAEYLGNAAKSGNSFLARFIVDKKLVSVDAASEGDATPFAKAVTEGHLDLASYLLSKGAKSDALIRNEGSYREVPALLGVFSASEKIDQKIKEGIGFDQSGAKPSAEQKKLYKDRDAAYKLIVTLINKSPKILTENENEYWDSSLIKFLHEDPKLYKKAMSQLSPAAKIKLKEETQSLFEGWARQAREEKPVVEQGQEYFVGEAAQKAIMMIDAYKTSPSADLFSLAEGTKVNSFAELYLEYRAGKLIPESEDRKRSSEQLLQEAKVDLFFKLDLRKSADLALAKYMIQTGKLKSCTVHLRETGKEKLKKSESVIEYLRRRMDDAKAFSGKDVETEQQDVIDLYNLVTESEKKNGTKCSADEADASKVDKHIEKTV